MITVLIIMSLGYVAGANALKAIADQVIAAIDAEITVSGFVTLQGWSEQSVFRSQADGTELATLDFHYLLLRA